MVDRETTAAEGRRAARTTRRVVAGGLLAVGAFVALPALETLGTAPLGFTIGRLVIPAFLAGIAALVWPWSAEPAAGEKEEPR